MAGKTKKKVDEPMSKTARASLAKKAKDEGFQASGELSRIVSLAGGEFCYLRDPRSGTLHHLRVGSAAWDTMISGLLADSKHGERIRAEVGTLGFPMPVEML